MRRGAVKIVAVLGAILLGLARRFGSNSSPRAYSIALSLFQLAGFLRLRLAAGDARSRARCWHPRTAASARLAIGAVIVIPFIATDFQALAPDIPVRLGALGALLVVTAVPDRGRRRRDAASGHSV